MPTRAAGRYDRRSMNAFGHTLFATPVGVCGIAWSARGIAAFQLPESSRVRTTARLLKRLQAVGLGASDAAEARDDAAPPADVRRAIDAVLELLHGTPVDLGFIALDESDIPAFERRVYAATRAISPGTTLSYGEVAARIGDPGAARAVGQALGRNPYAVIVPCHRVLAAGGAIGGFSAGGGAATKRRLLAIERARAGNGPDLFADDRPAATAPR
jgi:methylated-DNA-[protein]-cysteine S-methyltransferase